MVLRLVFEKGMYDLIFVYEKSWIKYKLVIVGDVDYDDEYVKSIRNRVNENVIIVGKRVGEVFVSLYKYCCVFVLFSYYEGYFIVVLEVISVGSNVLLLDI